LPPSRRSPAGAGHSPHVCPVLDPTRGGGVNQGTQLSGEDAMNDQPQEPEGGVWDGPCVNQTPSARSCGRAGVGGERLRGRAPSRRRQASDFEDPTEPTTAGARVAACATAARAARPAPSAALAGSLSARCRCDPCPSPRPGCSPRG